MKKAFGAVIMSMIASLVGLATLIPTTALASTTQKASQSQQATPKHTTTVNTAKPESYPTHFASVGDLFNWWASLQNPPQGKFSCIINGTTYVVQMNY